MTREQIEIFLGTLAVIAAVAVLVVVGFGEEARIERVSAQHRGELIEYGARVYEINCTSCHGTRAQGVPGKGPPLNDVALFEERVVDLGWEGTVEDFIVSIIAGGRQVSTRPEYVGAGRPVMPIWSDEFGGPLRPDEIEALSVFLMNYEGWVPPTAAVVEGAPEDRGRVIFLDAGCQGCHAVEGISTGIVGPDLTHIATVAGTRIEGTSAEDYLRESLLSPGAFLTEGYGDFMPATFGDSLSDQQLEDLLAFLLTLE